MRKLLFLVLVFLIGLNYSTAQTKRVYKCSATKELKKIYELNGEKISLDTINTDKMSKRNYKKLIKIVPPEGAIFLAQKNNNEWGNYLKKTIADSSMDTKKEYKSVKHIQKNIGNGVDYRDNFYLVLQEVVKRGTQKQAKKADRLNERLAKKFLLHGKTYPKRY